MGRKQEIDDQVVEDIARAADVDTRSVIRRLAGLPVRGRVGARVDRELALRGFAVQAPDEGHAA
jgi:hypothetical protein